MFFAVYAGEYQSINLVGIADMLRDEYGLPDDVTFAVFNREYEISNVSPKQTKFIKEAREYEKRMIKTRLREITIERNIRKRRAKGR